MLHVCSKAPRTDQYHIPQDVPDDEDVWTCENGDRTIRLDNSENPPLGMSVSHGEQKPHFKSLNQNVCNCLYLDKQQVNPPQSQFETPHFQRGVF